MKKPKRRPPSLATVRMAVADYMCAECNDAHVDAMFRLAELLQMEKTKAGGYDFSKYRSKT